MDKNSIYYLRDSLNHHYNIRNGLDQKASFLIGVSGIIFGLSINKLYEAHYLVLGIASLITVLLSIYVVFLPFRRMKTKKNLGIMCWWGFSDKTFDEYHKETKKIISSNRKITDEYLKEIWNLTNYSLKPKNHLLKIASIVLIIGLLGGLILFFV